MNKTTPSPICVKIPDKFSPLFDRSKRYIVFYGGRAGAKSHSVATAIIVRCYSEKTKVLCVREFMASMADSVHSLLVQKIETLGLQGYFSITRNSITSHNGSEIIFKGLRHNTAEIKSTEGIQLVWCEESSSISRESLEILKPTIRAEGSQLVFTFNTKNISDPVYHDYVLNTPKNCVTTLVNYYDNPFMSKTIIAEMQSMKEKDYEAFRHIWLGEPFKLSDAVIFKGRVHEECFETPPGVKFYFGLDLGYAKDPCALIRCFVVDNELFIDQEAFGYEIELDELDAWIRNSMPSCIDGTIYVDSARPETISYMQRAQTINGVYKKGLPAKACRKFPGSIEEQIQFLKSFKRIVVHEKNCPRIADEFRLYSYKTDRITGDVLPVIVDAHQHGIDALRYSLQDYMEGRPDFNMYKKAYDMSRETGRKTDLKKQSSRIRQNKKNWAI